MLQGDQDVDIMERCGEMEFSLYGRQGGTLVEGVENLNTWGGPWTK